MRSYKRWVAAAFAALASGAMMATGGLAADYPERGVRIIIGFPAGGGTDTVSRLLADALSKTWGQTVIAENRPGADGAIAAAAIADGVPDGYEIAVITNAHSITPAMREVPYDPIESFATIAQIATTPNFLVIHPSVPANNVDELIAYAKEHPGELTFGSSGTGTSPYLAMELFKQMAGIDMVHVPYRGGALAVIGLLSGEVDLMFVSPAAVFEHVEAGTLKALAISSPERWPGAPDVPTVAESGLDGFAAATWYGILAHKDTPPEIVEKLNTDIRAAMNSEHMKEQLANQGMDPVDSSVEEFREIIASDMVRWTEVVANIDEE